VLSTRFRQPVLQICSITVLVSKPLSIIPEKNACNGVYGIFEKVAITNA
jgi:hypothetical protein